MSLWFSLSSLVLTAFIACTIVVAEDHIVLAADIIRYIEAGGSIDYENVTVVGNLDLSTLEKPLIRTGFIMINSSIPDARFDGITFEKESIFWGTSFGNASFAGASFLGKVDQSNTTFRRASFAGTSFRQPVTFAGATFAGDVSFEDAQFEKDASFNWVTFSGDADFNYSSFGYYSYFSGARFAGGAHFSDIAFKGACDFTNANFIAETNFFQTDFKDAAGFDGAAFGGPAQFGLTRFEGLSSFGDALFDSEANFALARFADAAYFSRAKFHSDVLFGLVKFEDIASFQGATFQGDLNFKGGGISTLLLDDGYWGDGCRIILNDTDFNRLRASWRDIEDYVIWDPGAYLALVDNYRRLGWSADEDDCYYQYRSLDQAQKGWGWSRTIDIVAWLSCGYGVRPGYAVAWSLLTIIIFAMVFWKGDGIRRSAKPLQGPAEKDTVPERVTFRNALFFSTMIFLSQGPIDFLPVGRHRYYVILEGIMGWLLLALFLVTLGRVMIR